MRIPAPLLVFVDSAIRSITRVVFVITFLAILAGAFPAKSLAATPQTDPASIVSPNIDSSVPLNLHTFSQSVLIEALSATICTLGGFDILNPDQSCLGIDTKTRKLSYAPKSEQNNGQIGGIIGMQTDLIAALYTPPTSSVMYFQNVAHNFGIVKSTYAQPISSTTYGYGFAGLQPILGIWRSVLNIAYLFLVLIFVVIGLGIMLRIKIDPRTVMTIQNQLPRVVVSIILITFSYAIAAVLIDTMWVATYVGINTLTAVDNPSVNPQDPNSAKLSHTATGQLYQVPLNYINQIFNTNNVDPANNVQGHNFATGLINMTWQVSRSGGQLMKELIYNLFVRQGKGCVYMWGIDMGACMGNLFEWISTIVLVLIVFCILVVTLFRVWFKLLMAYVYTLLYVIVAPIWIAFGLLPNRPLGFEKWLRSLFANLAVFPLTVFFFVAARVLMDLFGSGGTQTVPVKFIPPLVGNPNLPAFGSLLGFAMILMTPSLLDAMRESMKMPGTKHGAAIGAAIAGGAAAPRAFADKTWKNLTYRHPQTGEAIGPLANLATNIGAKTIGKVPVLGSGFNRRRYVESHGTMAGYEKNWQERDTLQQQYREEAHLGKTKAPYHEWLKNQPDITEKRNRLAELEPEKNKKGMEGYHARQEAKKIKKELSKIEKSNSLEAGTLTKTSQEGVKERLAKKGFVLPGETPKKGEQGKDQGKEKPATFEGATFAGAKFEGVGTGIAGKSDEKSRIGSTVDKTKEAFSDKGGAIPGSEKTGKTHPEKVEITLRDEETGQREKTKGGIFRRWRKKHNKNEGSA